MWDDFYEAFANVSHRVLGRDLLPYCAYHKFWLKLIKSPLTSGGNVTLPDLEIASRICSSAYGKAEAAIKPRIGEKHRMIWRGLRYDLATEMAAFQAYADDFNSPPEPDQSGDANSTFTGEQIPHEIWLATGLMSLCHLTEEQAWMMPLGKAEWYLSIASMHHGRDGNILSGQDREFQAGIRAQRAAAAAKKSAEETTNGTQK